MTIFGREDFLYMSCSIINIDTGIIITAYVNVSRKTTQLFHLSSWWQDQWHLHVTLFICLRCFRICILCLVAISFAWLPILQRVQGSNFWDYVQSLASFTTPPTIAVFVMGLFWKRATEKVRDIKEDWLCCLCLSWQLNCYRELEWNINGSWLWVQVPLVCNAIFFQNTDARSM